MFAAEGHAECFNLLRAAGADLTVARTQDGKTAMQLHREAVARQMARASGARSDKRDARSTGEQDARAVEARPGASPIV